MATELASSGVSDALVVLGAAGLVIPAFARARISPVIGFILVGIAVGPFGLAPLVGRAHWLSWLVISDPAGMRPVAEIGIVLLLFSIGLHLSFRRLWTMRRQVFGTGAAELGVTAIVLALGLAATGRTAPAAVALGLALALSSTALVLPITGTSGPLGRASFAVLLFEDLALVPIVFLLGALSPHASGGAQGIAIVALVGIGTVAAMYGGGRLLLPPLFAQAARTRSPELFLAASLLVAIVASLVTASAGLSPIVGALLAGLLIAETPYHEEVEAIVKPFQGLALGVFLISVGMALDLRLVAERWTAILAALAAVVAVKAGLMAGLLRLTGTRGGVAAEGALLMGSPGETTLIVLGVATGGALLVPAEAAFWQAVTAIGMTVTPLLAWAGQRARRRVETAAPVIELDEHGPGTVIIGFGRVGRVVGELLTAHGRRWLAVDADVDNVATARAEGLPVRFGDAAR